MGILVLDIRCVRVPDTHLYNDLSSLLYSTEEWAPVLVVAVRSGRYPMPHMTTCLPTIATDRTSISRIQLVSATLVLGLVVLDCSLLVSSSHASLGVLYSGCFMGVSSVSWTIASSSAWVRSSNGVFLGR